MFSAIQSVQTSWKTWFRFRPSWTNLSGIRVVDPPARVLVFARSRTTSEMEVKADTNTKLSLWFSIRNIRLSHEICPDCKGKPICQVVCCACCTVAMHKLLHCWGWGAKLEENTKWDCRNRMWRIIHIVNLILFDWGRSKLCGEDSFEVSNFVGRQTGECDLYWRFWKCVEIFAAFLAWTLGGWMSWKHYVMYRCVDNPM